MIQGSVLGPILFILFIYDINLYLPDGVNIFKYADDILAYIIHGGPIGDLPQKIVDGIAKWCTINMMELNISKCKTLVVNPKLGTNSTPTLNGKQLEETDKYSYLGVVMTNDLNWDRQWQRVYSKISSNPFLLKALKKAGFITPILTVAYRSYALSHFVYSAPVLTSTSAAVKAEMAKFDRYCLKVLDLDPKDNKTADLREGVLQLIESTCLKLLTKIISEPSHPLTLSLKHKPLKRLTRNTGFPFDMATGKTAHYRNTFLQKHHITLRDGGKVNQYKCERNPDPVPSKYKKPSSLTQNQIFPLFAPRFILAKPKKSDKPTTKNQPTLIRVPHQLRSKCQSHQLSQNSNARVAENS